MAAKLEHGKESYDAREIDPNWDLSHPFNFSLVRYYPIYSFGSR